MIPKGLRGRCLYDGSPDMLSSRIQDVWHLGIEDESKSEMAFIEAIKPFDAITACKAMDERLSALVSKHGARR